MTYELVLKLKETGFPQPRGNTRGMIAAFKGEMLNDCYDPTLSELIEACEGFVILRKNADKTFAAFGGNEQYPEGSCEKHGPTPEEAVANLYLALKN